MTDFYATTVLGSSAYVVLWSFVVYAFVGVVLEVAFHAVVDGTLESTTGLLYLPLRPLYGVGGCGFVLLLHPVVAQPVAVFVLGAVVATVAEYVASLVTQLAFGAVSWDYSHLPLNVHGRVCLSYSLCWGGLALVALYLVDRPLRDLLAVLPRATGEAALNALVVLALLSGAVTVAALVRARRRVADLRAGARDDHAATTGTFAGRLVDRLVPERVLVGSFPRMTLVAELLELTGRQQAWIRLPRPPLKRVVAGR